MNSENKAPKLSLQLVVLSTVFVAGMCSLVYELLISTTSSYFLGDSVKQFSLTIGVYMAAMGLGAYLTQLLRTDLLVWFIRIELLLGIIGGACVPILYFTFERTSTAGYQFIMLLLTFVIGVLTGFEVPLLIRLLKTRFPLRANLANVLGLDYFGALIATLLFPFILLPFVGTFRSSILFGLTNIIMGWVVYRYFLRDAGTTSAQRWLEVGAVVAILSFATLSFFSTRLLAHWEDQFYRARIVYSEQTPYQQITLTQNQDDLRLYINRIIQFSSVDEYRYHESLALIPLQTTPYRKRVLVLGGGEGLLVRELLKAPDIESVTVVDLDTAIFRLATQDPRLVELNHGALLDLRVRLVTNDAMQFLRDTPETYDLIIADLPDPSNESLARLYSTAFYRLVRQRLSAYGVFATQASSPFHTRNAYWCIVQTLRRSEFRTVQPYHTYVPSFGEWGFVLAYNFPAAPTDYEIPYSTRYLAPALLPQMFYFAPDISEPIGTEPNRLDQPALLQYFLEDWERWRVKQQTGS